MKPSATKDGECYYPVIIHADGHREIIYGAPLVNFRTAKHFAELHIYDRKNR